MNRYLFIFYSTVYTFTTYILLFNSYDIIRWNTVLHFRIWIMCKIQIKIQTNTKFFWVNFKGQGHIIN